MMHFLIDKVNITLPILCNSDEDILSRVFFDLSNKISLQEEEGRVSALTVPSIYIKPLALNLLRLDIKL